MNPKASFGNRFRSKLQGIKPSATRDCSTCQFRYAALSELEFHNKPSRLTKALLETAKDMKDAGVLGKAAYEKITMRHLSLKDKNKLIEPPGSSVLVRVSCECLYLSAVQ